MRSNVRRKSVSASLRCFLKWSEVMELARDVVREVGAESDELLGGTINFGCCSLPRSDCDSESVRLRCQEEGGLPFIWCLFTSFPELPDNECRLLLCADDCNDELLSGMIATLMTSGLWTAELDDMLIDRGPSEL
jgi:hypothetical protein